MRTIKAAVFALLAAAAWSAVSAQTARLNLDIKAQPMALALKDLGEKTGLQIMFRTEDVADEGIAAPHVSGELSAAQALDQLLKNTGLAYKFVNRNTVLISRIPAESAEEPVKQAPEVTVTGSRIPVAAKEGAQETKRYSAEQIRQSGQSTVASFLNTLPEVSTAFTESPFQQNGLSTVTLRGLPFGTTLVLLDGRRVESTGASTHPFFDLNSIPTSAVERIEIVPEGSSAIYGSDALAGVVNIILKDRVEGIQADTRYGFAAGTDEASTDMMLGHTWSRGSVSLIGNYYTRSELTGAERSITSDQDFRSLGGTDRRVTYCNPGTVYSTNGANLPGLSASSAAIPAGITGTPTVQDFVTTAGQVNKCGYYSQYSVLPETHRASFLLNGSYEVASWMTVFSQVMYSRFDEDVKSGSAPLYHVVVPASNPYNPFGTAVDVDYGLTQLRAEAAIHTDFFRPLVGAKGDILEKWHWEVSAWESQDRDSINQANSYRNTANLNAALNSTNAATALNLFSSQAAPLAILDALYNPSLSHEIGQSQATNAFVRGPLIHLPQGDVEAVIGAEYTRDKYGVENSPAQGGAAYTYRRNEISYFGEIRVPIIDTLAANVALRHDDYDDFGQHSTPQYSVEWRPLDSLLVRASYAKAFRAPSLYNLYSTRTPHPNYNVTDPLQGGRTESITYLSGGNLNLNPETGQSRSFGLVWSPEFAQELRMSATYWSLDQANRVTQPDAQTVINYASLFPGRVVRNPDGTIASVDASYLNFGSLKTSGLDADVLYKQKTAFGVFSPSLSLTEVYNFKAAITPGVPVSDRLSKANTDAWAPRWKGTVALNWRQGSFSARVDGRFVGSYRDYAPLTSGPDAGTYLTLGNFWLYDLNTTCELGALVAPRNTYLKTLYISAGVVNLSNSLPRFSQNGAVGYDPTQYDIVGRFVYFNLGLRI